MLQANRFLPSVMMAVSCALLGGGGLINPAYAQSQTAQSVMVDLTYDSTAYLIDGTIAWTFDRGTIASPGCAMQSYTNDLASSTPVITTGTGADPGPVAAPLPDATKLQQHAQDQRCTFFCGGQLTQTSYTQTVTQVRGWKRTFTYDITPSPSAVPGQTCWTSQETGGSVDVSFDGFACSESFLKQSSRNKYSFTLFDSSGAPRVENVKVALQKQGEGNGWSTVRGPVDVTPVTGPKTQNFDYYGNAGAFGNSAVLSDLHSAQGKDENSVFNILNGKAPNGTSPENPDPDNFAGNNNDLAAGNVHVATFDGEWPGLTEAGTYRTLVTGTLKGNAGSAAIGFSAASNIVTIGGCTCGN